jgi:hypothetical protein
MPFQHLPSGGAQDPEECRAAELLGVIRSANDLSVFRAKTDLNPLLCYAPLFPPVDKPGYGSGNSLSAFGQ